MNRPIMEFKDAGGEGQQALHPEVQQEVLKQVQALSGNAKELVSKMNSEYASLVEAVKAIQANEGKMDGLMESKVTKLTEALVTRQEALDKMAAEHKSRMDQLDLAIQRQGRGAITVPEDEVKLFEAAREFKAAQNIMRGITNKEVEDSEVDVKFMADYRKAFNAMLRTNINQAGISPELMKLLSVGSDADGGILVPPTVSGRINTRVWELDPIRQLARVEQIGTDSWEEMFDVDQAGDGWASETVTNDQTTTPTWKRVSIPVFFQEAEPRATQKLLEDASRNMEQWLSEHVARKFARSEGAAFVSGTGIDRPRGFLNYSVYANSTTLNNYVFGQVEYVPCGDSVLTTSGLITQFYHLLDEFQARATWLMNRFTVMKIMLMVDTAGRPLWQPASSATIAVGAPSTLLGAPVRMSASMPSIAASAYPIALADWQEAYVIVDRLGITTLRDPYTAKPFIKFFTRRRVGGGVLNFQAINLQKIATS